MRATLAITAAATITAAAAAMRLVRRRADLGDVPAFGLIDIVAVVAAAAVSEPVITRAAATPVVFHRYCRDVPLLTPRGAHVGATRLANHVTVLADVGARVILVATVGRLDTATISTATVA